MSAQLVTRWQPWLASGAGWVAQGGETTVDPYLVWAEITALAGLHADGEPAPGRLRALVELCDKRRPAELAQRLGDDGRVPQAYTRLATRYCTAELGPAAWRALSAPGNGLVERMVLAMPVHARRTTGRRPAPVAAAEVAGSPQTDQPTLLAVIDTGCPFAHAALLRDGEPRILSLWDQDPAPAFARPPFAALAPAAFGYGRMAGRRELADCMNASRERDRSVNEDRCYERAGLPELRRVATHGAHVLGQLAGTRRVGNRIGLAPGQPPDFAKKAFERASDTSDIVFVQLPRAVWCDPNGLALGASVLDGLHHALGCKGEATRLVVANVSCATHAGPHDGSTILDRALADLVDQQRQLDCQLELFVPAGNAYRSGWHATGVVTPSRPGRLALWVPPGNEAPAFVEIWVDGPPRQVRWSIRPPAADGLQRQGPGVQVLGRDGQVVAVAQHNAGGTRGRPGTQHTLLMLALSPAASADHRGAAGLWTIEVELVGAPASASAAVDGYIARCESEMGAPLRHRPLRWIDPSADPQRFLREAEDDPADDAGRPTLRLTRRGTVGNPASGPAVFGVGGACLRPDTRPAPYAGHGLFDNSGSAVAEESRALPGLPGLGTRSGSVVRLSGTSFASPLLARVAADRYPLTGQGPRGEPSELGVLTQPGMRAAFDRRLGKLLAIPRDGNGSEVGTPE